MSEVLYFLYSTNSPACQPLLPVMKNISNYITVHPIDIDVDPMIRDKIGYTDIQTVPCLLVHTPDKIMILENQELTQFIKKIIEMIQHNNTPQPQPQPSQQVTSLVNPAEIQQPPPPLDTSYNANVNSRLGPMEFSGPPMDVQQPQSKSEKSVNFDDMLISGGIDSIPATVEEGYSMNDILAGEGGSKASTEKTSKVKSYAENMKNERDEEESKFKTRKS